MFNSTHTLVGLALSRAGLNRVAPNATWTAVIAANLPDIDIVAGFPGTAVYLDLHRGITHAIVGIPILSILLAAVMYSISRRVAPRATIWRHFIVALVAMATHPILDLANTYGIRPFLPFGHRWYYGDTLFVIDPYLDLILVAALVAGGRLPGRRRLSAATGLLLALAYVAVRLELRDMATRKLESADGISSSSRTAVSPQMLNPFQWTGLVDTPQNVSIFSISLRSGQVERTHRFSKAAESEITAAARGTYTGRVFAEFARFPVTRVESTASGYRVVMIDVRFFRPANSTALAAEILMDSELRVVRETMGFTLPAEVEPPALLNP